MKPFFLLAAALSLAASASRAETWTPAQLSARAVERAAIDAAIWGMPAVNYDLMLQEMLTKTAARPNQIVFWGRPLDWHNQTLTPNPDTIYFMLFYDTKDGPIVLEIPPADSGALNANVVNVWQMPLEDLGKYGVDKGAGGKFLITPPGYAMPVPSGYAPIPSDTYAGFALLRSNLKSHGDADVAASIAYGKRARVYPLSRAADPPPTLFIDAQDVLFDSTIRYDVGFYAHLARVVQSEPWLDRDRAMIDELRLLGIEKGKPFRPDGATGELLTKAIDETRQLLAARYEIALPPYWEGSHWRFPAVPELVKAAGAAYADPNVYPVQARGLAYTYAYIGIKHLGAGQFYLISIDDRDGRRFDGAATYRLTVPPNAPVEQYWSVTAYDRVTHALIRDVPRASRSSQLPELKKNADGSVDVFFGSKPPPGEDANWIPTDPHREFEVMFRLYAPTKALFDKLWILPDVERRG